MLCQAQDKDSKFSVGVSVGPSFAIGKFGDKIYDDIIIESNANPSGLAKSGWVIDFTADYRLTKTIGIILLLGHSENKQDPASFEHYVIQQYGSNHTIFVKTNDWKVAKVLTGGLFTLPVSKSARLSLRSKLLAGFCKTSTPSNGYAVLGVTNSVNGAINLPWTFCYQITAGASYKIYKRIYINGAIGYFDASPAHKYKYYPNSPLTNVVDNGKNVYRIESINPMIGLEYRW
jgi:hypothetical protein